MNLKQFLLNKIIDEAVELAQAAGKTVEHGEDDFNPKEKKTCLEHLRFEFADVNSAMHLYNHLIEWLAVNKDATQGTSSTQYMHDPKSIKIIWFAMRARNKGRLVPEGWEKTWLAGQGMDLFDQLEQMTVKMQAEFGLTPFK